MPYLDPRLLPPPAKPALRVFTADVIVYATVYIKAATEDDAKAIFEKHWRGAGLSINDDEWDPDGTSFMSAATGIDSLASPLTDDGPAEGYFSDEEDD